MGLVRFGVSIEKDLLYKFDNLCRKNNYANRSEAFRNLIRKELVGQEWRLGDEVVGAVTLVYDHHKKELVNKLTDIQHNFQGLIISTQHIHLDHDNCLEIIAARGEAGKIKNMADTLRSVKGVKHGTLSMSSTGKHIK